MVSQLRHRVLNGIALVQHLTDWVGKLQITLKGTDVVSALQILFDVFMYFNSSIWIP